MKGFIGDDEEFVVDYLEDGEPMKVLKGGSDVVTGRVGYWMHK